VEDLERALKVHPFLHDLQEPHLRFVVGCARNVRWGAGEYLHREGQAEHALFLIRTGSVALEVSQPGSPPLVVETLEPGDAFGVSWMLAARAHAGTLDARARDSVVCFRLDGDCLKRKMDADPALGYAIATRLLERTYERLARARLQRMDVYR
jgi:CRP/FNR family cyclic AMP-dependent transcriptional regulator